MIFRDRSCAERAWWVFFIWLRVIPTSGSSIAYCRVVHGKINEKHAPTDKVSKVEHLIELYQLPIIPSSYSDSDVGRTPTEAGL
jgi:hypothetical protein